MAAENDLSVINDITALSSVTAAQIQQITSTAQPISTRGFVIKQSTTPDVANNARFTRYLWLDSSVDPPILKRYKTSTTSWVEVVPSDGSIVTAQLADLSVTTAKLANSAVTTAKLASSSVATANLIDGAVTEAKIGTNAVTTSKVIDSGITTAKIADDAITSAKIAAGAVGTIEIANSAVGADQVANSSLPVTKLDSNANKQLCKAWGKFDGTTGVLLASFGVTSVTRNSAGTYTVALTTAMADANYVVSLVGYRNADTTFALKIDTNTPPTTTSFRIMTYNDDGGTVPDDFSYIGFAVFGN